MAINIDAQHQAVILMKTEVMERNPDGSVTGRPVRKHSKVYTIIGDNLGDVEAKAKTLHERITTWLKENQTKPTHTESEVTI